MIPLIDIVKKKELHPIKVGIAVALMFQLHFISSLILVLLYAFAFIYSFFSSNRKKHLLLQLVIAISIFTLLTLNIWMALYKVYKNNNIVHPFINQHIYQNTITGSSWYWLVCPFILPIIILLVLFITIKRFKRMSIMNKFLSLSGFFFLFLSSSVFPWKILYEKQVEWINLIQFPFRFFIPTTICLLCSLGLSISEGLFTLRYKKVVTVIIVLCFVHSLALYTDALLIWNHKDSSFLTEGEHLFIKSKDYDKVKASFYSHNLNESLEFVQKSTPDYLPVYHDNKDNKYKLYEEYVLFNQLTFTKKIDDNSHLVVQWESDGAKSIVVPVIIYDHTKIIVNGKELKNYSLTPIGNPIIQSKEGENVMEISY